MLVAGVDEAGRGPLAGPVVAAAVVFPTKYINPEIKDSKQLSSKIREKLFNTIKKDALYWSIVAVGHRRIEKLNILQASRFAMKLAVSKICCDFVLVDGNIPIDVCIPQTTVIGGDAIHVQISAASILAKVWRDHLMTMLDKKYPGYELGKHAGYGTKLHKACIEKLGPSPVHRRTFSGVCEFFDISRNSQIQAL